MTIYLGADHNGFAFKHELLQTLQASGYAVKDVGDVSQQPDDDFPQFAAQAVQALKTDAKPDDARAILVCGSGQGMCMAANRYKGIRASLCWDVEEARAARNDDDSNVLCLSSRYTSPEQAMAIVSSWLSTPFAGAARFKRRIRQLDELG